MIDYFFFTYDIKNYYYISTVLHFWQHASHNDLPRTSFGDFRGDATYDIKKSDVTFNVSCELSQPICKTELSSAAKISTNSVA